MEIDKVRKLSQTDLSKEIDKTVNTVAQLKSEVAMHRIKNWTSLRTTKKYLAQLLTIKREQEIIKAIGNE
jgi:ribosomal protein L29